MGWNRNLNIMVMVDILCQVRCIFAAGNIIRKISFEQDVEIWRTVLGACKVYKNVELADEAILGE